MRKGHSRWSVRLRDWVWGSGGRGGDLHSLLTSLARVASSTGFINGTIGSENSLAVFPKIKQSHFLSQSF